MPYKDYAKIITKFLSTPSARRATTTILSARSKMSYFYPRPPRGGRPCTTTARRQTQQFLSTPSARRATCCAAGMSICVPNFYPRPPRGGRPAEEVGADAGDLISIHALREEGDTSGWQPTAARSLFLSTPSARRATGGHSFTLR